MRKLAIHMERKSPTQKNASVVAARPSGVARPADTSRRNTVDAPSPASATV
jgi:hypothetical protein